MPLTRYDVFTPGDYRATATSIGGSFIPAHIARVTRKLKYATLSFSACGRQSGKV